MLLPGLDHVDLLDEQKKTAIKEIKFQYGTILLKNDGKGWIWGITYAIPKRGEGGTLVPDRRLGKKFCATTKENALMKAVDWFKECFGIAIQGVEL